MRALPRATARPWLATAVLATGCGTSSSASTASVPARALTVRCHAAPARPAAVAARTSLLRLPGSPDGLAATPDGRYAFVALQSGAPRIAVVRDAPSGARLLRTVALPARPSGMRVTPDGRYVLAAAGPGAIVLDAAAAISGAPRAVLGALTAPARVAGAGPGAAEVAVSAGSRYAFVTLEGAGRIAVFDLRAAAATGFSDSGYLGAVPVGAGALGLATAPGGRLLYEVSESSRAPGSRTRGVLNVVDLRRALTAPAAAVIAAAPAPCAPVRVAVAPDGTRVWVTARDGNALLGFSAGALRAAPARALTSVTPVGAAPLGLVAVGTRVLVADADLGHTPGARSALSVLDVSDPTAPRLLGEVGIAALADAVAATSDGRRALLTASGGDALESLLLP